MRTLLTGGSACGKSSLAEALTDRLAGPKLYIATMRPYGPESLEKITLHQRARSHRGFCTVECYDRLTDKALPPCEVILLECICNLAANQMFSNQGPVQNIDYVYEHILSDIRYLERQCKHLFAVTNEVGSDLNCYSQETRRYIALMGLINRVLAARFERVIELVCGIPITHKGRLPSVESNGERSHMRLIIGPASSGKRTYVQQLGYHSSDMADGILDHHTVLYNLQDLVAQDPMHSESLLPDLLQKEVVICNEVGSGIIPENYHQRITREQTGRLCTVLARHAKQVIRLVCGIPIVLKQMK